MGALLVAWAICVGLLTLTGTPQGLLPVGEGVLCLACGSSGLADMIANWLLFVPVGVLSAGLWGFEWAVRASVLATFGIEGLQIFLPGRNPALQDVVANALGGLTGAWLARGATGVQVSRSFAALALAGWLSPVVLLTPYVPSGALFGDWTYDWPMLERYDGELLTATIGGAPVGLGELSDSDEVRRGLEARLPLELRLVVGGHPAGLAPVFSVFDSQEREIVLLAVIGDDIIYRGWTWAKNLRLDQPDVRWSGALATVAIGDTVAVRVVRDRASYCMSVDGEARCGLAAGIGDGWAFIRNVEGGPTALRTLLSLVWSLGLGAAVGVSAEPRSRGVGLAAAMALIGGAMGFVIPHVRPAPLAAVSFLVGGLVGARLRGEAIRWTDLFRGGAHAARAAAPAESTS